VKGRFGPIVGNFPSNDQEPSGGRKSRVDGEKSEVFEAPNVKKNRESELFGANIQSRGGKKKKILKKGGEKSSRQGGKTKGKKREEGRLLHRP